MLPTSRDVRSPSVSKQPGLVRLLTELFTAIEADLPNRDRKSLRQGYRALRDRVNLRLERLFLSANPLNIEVFRAVADHERFRHNVVEIVWDDALLVDKIIRTFPFPEEIERQFDDPSLEGCLGWFARACQKSNKDLKSHKTELEEAQVFTQGSRKYRQWGSADADIPKWVARMRRVDAQLPYNVLWDHYQQLLLQQEEILACAADAEALRYGLSRLPSLRKITVTPAAHGFLYMPVYETPMIRAFPYGFNYPISPSWPTIDPGDRSYMALPWNDGIEKTKWRGFNIVLGEFAKLPSHNVSELSLDTHMLLTGLNCGVFDEPCEEYDNLVTLLRRPGFRRLDLALLGDGQQLKKALAEATHLEHFGLRVQLNEQYANDLEDAEQFPKLSVICPIDKWQNLRSLRLENIPIRPDDLVEFFNACPNTLRSIELCCLIWSDQGPTWGDLVERMREDLSWRKRPVGEKPNVTICCDPRYTSKFTWRTVWLVDEVYDFLHADGPNPFEKWEGRNTNMHLEGMGVEQDPFEVEY